MSKEKRVSSKDVAKEAGVSQATVSYVLNNVQGIKIKQETKMAVLEAAQRLNYHPNVIARGMRLNKSMSIGVVSDKNMSSYVFMSVLEGIKDALVSKNYSITLCVNKADRIEDADYIKYYSSNRIDGIIFAYANLTEEQIGFMLDNNIPFVMIHAHMKDEMPHLVKTDMSDAIYRAMAHLTQKGIRKIGYIGTSAGNLSTKRYEGYVEALKRLNIPLDENVIYTYSGVEEQIEKELEHYFKRLGSIPQAVLCDTANMGFYTLRYAAKKGIKVPEDLAVIAIGTSQFSNRTYPSLSAIEAPLYNMGSRGCEMLFDIMGRKQSDDVVTLEWDFVVRESSERLGDR